MGRALIEKSAICKFPIGLKYYPPDLDTAETITAVTCAITPTGEANDLATDGAVAIAADGKSFSWVVKDGIAGKEYTVLFKVTTSTGKIFNHPITDSILVDVRS